MARVQHSSTFFQFFKIIWEDNLSDEEIRLPNKFTRRFEMGLPNPVLFKIPADGTEWRVRWRKRDGAIWFRNGWKEFAEHYSLGHWHMILFKYELATSHFDICIFDQNSIEIDYSCHHYTNDDSNEEMMLESELDAPYSPPIQQVRGTPRRISKNPSFEITMQPSYLTGRCIAVPQDFAKKHLKEGPVRVKVGDRTWHMKFKIWTDSFTQTRKCKIQSGWAEFRRDNSLDEDDVCVFELTDSTKVTFKVEIRRAAE